MPQSLHQQADHTKLQRNSKLISLRTNLMVSTEASWWNILTIKIYTTLGYIVSLILLNLRHVFHFRIISRTYGWVLVKQYNQELCISSYSLRTWMTGSHILYSHTGCKIYNMIFNKLQSLKRSTSEMHQEI